MSRWQRLACLCGLVGVLGMGFQASCIEVVASTPGSCSAHEDCPSPGNLCHDNRCVTGCQSDADCRQGQRCEFSPSYPRGRCFDACQSDDDCADGDLCDALLRRCLCTQVPCELRQGYACHPQRRQCALLCTRDSDCDPNERCVGDDGKKHCLPKT